MSDTTDITSAGGASKAKDSGLPDGLRDADAKQLYSLYDALETISGVLDALLCQPRFSAHPECDWSLNAAGKQIDALSRRVGVLSDRIVARAQTMQVSDPGSSRYRDQIILAAEIRVYESTEQVAAVAAERAWKRH